MAASQSAPKFLASDCFTCLRGSTRSIPVFAMARQPRLDPTTVIIDYLEAYFWFKKSDFRMEHILCGQCWERLKAFHCFYMKVKRNRYRSLAVEAGNCFTCFFSTDDRTPILSKTESSRTVVSDLIAQHLDFTLADFNAEHAICRICLNQLVTFHSFYVEVQQNHGIRDGAMDDVFQVDEDDIRCEEKEAKEDSVDGTDLLEELIPLNKQDLSNESQIVVIDDDSQSSEEIECVEIQNEPSAKRCKKGLADESVPLDRAKSLKRQRKDCIDGTDLVEELVSLNKRELKNGTIELEEDLSIVIDDDSQMSGEIRCEEIHNKSCVERDIKAEVVEDLENELVLLDGPDHLKIQTKDCVDGTRIEENLVPMDEQDLTTETTDMREELNVLIEDDSQMSTKVQNEIFQDNPPVERDIKAEINEDLEKELVLWDAPEMFEISKRENDLPTTFEKVEVQNIPKIEVDRKADKMNRTEVPKRSEKLKKIAKIMEKFATKEGKEESDNIIQAHIPYECSVCLEECESFVGLKRHMVKVHNMKGGVVCCGRLYYHKKLLFLHVLKVKDKHIGGQFQCGRCHRRYNDGKRLEKHITGHANRDQELFKCQRCEFNFSFSWGYKTHLQNGQCEETAKRQEMLKKKEEISKLPKKVPVRKRIRTSNKPKSEKTKLSEELDRIILTHFQYTCSICHVEPGSFSALKNHLVETHDTKAGVSCCGKLYFHKRQLYDHVLTRKKQIDANEFQCHQCLEQFQDAGQLERHMQQTHGSKDDALFKCQHCGINFLFMTRYKNHLINGRCAAEVIDKEILQQKLSAPLSTEAPRKAIRIPLMGRKESDAIILTHVKYTCSDCQLDCGAFQSLKQHLADAHGKMGGLSCCGMKYSNKGRLLMHVLGITNNLKEVYCDRCDRRFRNPELLRRHMIGHDNKDNERYKCNECRKCFAFKPPYLRHLESSHELVTCNICGRKMPKESLQEHLEVHESNPNELVLKCKICQRAFLNEGSFKNHMRSHTKPKDCDICGVTCANNGALNRHHYNHHSKRKKTPSNCQTCNRTFPDDRALHRHMRKEHRATDQESSSNKAQAAKFLTCKKCNISFTSVRGLSTHGQFCHAPVPMTQHWNFSSIG